MIALKKSQVIAVTVVAVSALTAGAVAAAPPDRAPDKAPAAVPVAVAPYARAAAVVAADGTLVRAKAVSSVKRVALGEYCVKVSASGFDVRTAVSEVSVNLSGGKRVFIEVARSTQPLCGNNATTVLVQTSSATARLNAGFTLAVL